MTARALGEILAGKSAGKIRRTFQPVRRNSFHMGERESRWYRPIDKQEIGARIRAAKVYDRTHKKAGRKNGALGSVAIEVLELMYGVIDRRSGRLDPSIDYMMRKLRRSRDAIVRALANLKQHGFLEWIRRTVPVDNPGECGPQVKQISNAYRLDLPAKVRALVALIRRAGAPTPDDDAQRRAQDKAATEEMIEGLPTQEKWRQRVESPELAATLARMDEGLQRKERESE